MLETIREYAAEELAQSGEAQMTDDPATHATSFASQKSSIRTSRSIKYPPCVAPRTVSTTISGPHWAGRSKRVKTKSRCDFATTLVRFWTVRAPAEGLDWLERSLACTPDAPQALCTDARCAAGEAAWFSGDPERAHAHFTAALELARAANDQARVAMTLTRLAPPLFLVAADFDGAKKV